MNREVIPNLSVDCALFSFDGNQIKILLRQEKILLKGKTYNKYKLPGDHPFMNEIIENTAERILFEQTGARDIFMKQFWVFSSLDRLKRNEVDFAWIKNRGLISERVITVGFYSFVKKGVMENQHLIPEATWVNIHDVKNLIFDHEEILQKAREQIKKDIEHQPLVFELLPAKFTLAQLHNIYELLLEKKLDRRNFRRKVLLAMPYVKELSEKQKGVAHKPAKFYAFDKKIYDKHIIHKTS